MRPDAQMQQLKNRFNEIDNIIKLKQVLIGYKGPNHDLVGKVIYFESNTYRGRVEEINDRAKIIEMMPDSQME